MSYNVFIVANFRTNTLSFIRQEVGMRKHWMEYTQVGKTMVKGEEIKPNRVRFELVGKSKVKVKRPIGNRG